MFRDREQAGRKLAARLRERSFRDPLVLGIPRGGVVTGAALADGLGAELDIVLARKLRAPGQPELAVGAVSETGEVYLNREIVEALGDLDDFLEAERRYQMAEIERRKKLFRSVKPAATVRGRSVIVTDDGIATGSTMIAALKVARAQEPYELIVAVPVASPDRLVEIRRLADEVVCLLAPESFWAIGQFYEDFTQVADEEVVEILKKHRVPADVAGAQSAK
jgi:putative phosphoribosyl transferase